MTVGCSGNGSRENKCSGIMLGGCLTEKERNGKRYYDGENS